MIGARAGDECERLHLSLAFFIESCSLLSHKLN